MALPGGWTEIVLAAGLVTVIMAGRGRTRLLPGLVIFLAAILGGSGVGGARMEAIQGAAFSAADGEQVELSGFVSAFPRQTRDRIMIPVSTAQGRLMVEATARAASLEIGDEVSVSGTASAPPEWLRPEFERRGISVMLTADRLLSGDAHRGGVAGLIDGLRIRASRALESGMPPREASLAKGFVLGQDQSIDQKTVEDFRASNLAHLLAVSGQNIVLLGLLAIPFMALLNLGPMQRIIFVALLIAIYVPLTGAGPSIQRAGVMGLAGLVALAASRPSSKAYAVVLAVVVTLIVNPRASGDIGWQLSFAAVIGILLLAGPLQTRLGVLLGAGSARRLLASGLAVTTAATLATAPLMAFHFERLSLTGLPANILAMPAVAPAMWLGMVSAALGQAGAALAVPFNLLNSVLLAYIAWVASWLGGPSWGELKVGSAGAVGVLIAYAALIVFCAVALGLSRPSRLGQGRPPEVLRRSRRSAAILALCSVSVVLGAGMLLGDSGRRQLAEPPPGGVRVEVFDVGQGDAILIRPDSEDPILIDGGPPGGDLVGALDSAGVEKLSAVVLTHGDLDHVGGLYDIFGSVPTGHLFFDFAPAGILNLARQAGTELDHIAQGDRLKAGPAWLDFLWPPEQDPGMDVPEEPNSRSILIELRVGRFRMLLTGDGEAELVPVRPGRVDVLKLAHHGSDDAGLPGLLASTDPDLAVISVGEGNPFGHPTRDTIEQLGDSATPYLRTDLSGTVSLVIDRSGWSIESGS